MNPEAIKVGDKINIEAIVIRKLHSEEQLITCELPTGLQFHVFQRDFEALSPANGIKNAEPLPKYDPCRKLREGDKVRFRKVNKRFTYELDATLLVGSLGRVAFDERESGAVKVYCFDGVLRVVDANYLELVTPVEEMKPYYVEQSTSKNYWEIYHQSISDGITLLASYSKHHPHAKEAAEAECDRLNAEHRKEQEQ